ncbi:MAG: hypothetical protein KME15_01975 [Drouetiella hepatica Uher 2000/2452]|jgi:hypothetical protein|uniref:Uncharacterized protein n=1 Tax=Drouetiella hepatica Uher 2000/2452 TaxID=904376 RepID=A0A951Q901_9CYAN|nr:hypothetical protein [Drouetiella hepatica Uher 2000/2452]
MKIRFPWLLALGLLSLTLPAQAAVIPEATAAARAAQRQGQARQVRPENYDLRQRPLSDWTFWRNMLWTTATVEPQEEFVADGIAQMLSFAAQNKLPSTQKRVLDMAMTVGNQLYLSNPSLYASIGQQFSQTIAQSSDPYWVAIALSALSKGNSSPEQRQQWSNQVRQRFPNWGSDVYLNSTLREVDAIDRPVPLPPLADLLNGSIASNQPQMYVLCRPDRGVLCQAVLKDGKGSYVRENGQLWSVPLLLRSLHNLSSVFTRGQTPQGIYRIVGTTPQPDTDYFRAFGLFSLVNLYIPLETSDKLPTTLTAYQNLLPSSWRNYFPIQQTYWAGKGERDSFRIHGTGESPDFFSSNSRYPNSQEWNPSIGCLSALELYDAEGRLQQADMPKILGALRAVGGQNFTGYLVVVDVPGGDAPVSLSEIEAAISGIAAQAGE